MKSMRFDVQYRDNNASFMFKRKLLQNRTSPNMTKVYTITYVVCIPDKQEKNNESHSPTLFYTALPGVVMSDMALGWILLGHQSLSNFI